MMKLTIPDLRTSMVKTKFTVSTRFGIYRFHYKHKVTFTIEILNWPLYNKIPIWTGTNYMSHNTNHLYFKSRVIEEFEITLVNMVKATTNKNDN